MSYQMVDQRKYALLLRWQLLLMLGAVLVTGLVLGGTIIFLQYRAPAMSKISECQGKLDEATRLTRRAQDHAFQALADNVGVLSQAEHVAEETLFHSEQLFRRSRLSRKSRDAWAEALEEAKATGVGGPEPGD